MLRAAHLKATPEPEHRDYEQPAQDRQERIDSGAGSRRPDPGEK